VAGSRSCVMERPNKRARHAAAAPRADRDTAQPSNVAGLPQQLDAAEVAAPVLKSYHLRLTRAATQSYLQYMDREAGSWRSLVSITEKQSVHHLALLRRIMARVMPGNDRWMTSTWTCVLPFPSEGELKEALMARKTSWLVHIWEQEQNGNGHLIDQQTFWPPPYPVE
jgi:hypothetical protein